MRVLITQPAQDAETTAALLRARGHTVLSAPLVVSTRLPPPTINLSAAQGFVVSGGEGARALAEHVGVRTFPVFTDSAATVEVLRGLRFQWILVAKDDTADLARLVERTLKPSGGALIHACHNGPASNLGALLGNMGFALRPLPLYSLKRVGALPPEIAAALRDKALDAAVFLAPEEARAFVALVQQEKREGLTKTVAAVAASPVIAAPLRALKFRGVTVPPGGTLDDMALALDSALVDQVEIQRTAAENRAREEAERERIAKEQEQNAREARADAERQAKEEERRRREQALKEEAERKRVAEERAKAERDAKREQQRLEDEARAAAQRAAEEQARLAREKAVAEEADRKHAAEQRAEAERDAKRQEEEARAAGKRAAEEQARIAREQAAKQEAERKRIAEGQAQAERETRRLEEEARIAAQRAAEAQARLAREQAAKEEAERKRVAEEQARITREAERERQRLEDETRAAARREVEEQARLAREQIAKEEAEGRHRAEEQARLERETERERQHLADAALRIARGEADERARIAREQAATEDAERRRIAAEQAGVEREAQRERRRLEDEAHAKAKHAAEEQQRRAREEREREREIAAAAARAAKEEADRRAAEAHALRLEETALAAAAEAEHLARVQAAREEASRMVLDRKRAQAAFAAQERVFSTKVQQDEVARIAVERTRREDEERAAEEARAAAHTAQNEVRRIAAGITVTPTIEPALVEEPPVAAAGSGGGPGTWWRRIFVAAPAPLSAPARPSWAMMHDSVSRPESVSVPVPVSAQKDTPLPDVGPLPPPPAAQVLAPEPASATMAPIVDPVAVDDGARSIVMPPQTPQPEHQPAVSPERTPLNEPLSPDLPQPPDIDPEPIRASESARGGRAARLLAEDAADDKARGQRFKNYSFGDAAEAPSEAERAATPPRRRSRSPALLLILVIVAGGAYLSSSWWTAKLMPAAQTTVTAGDDLAALSARVQSLEEKAAGTASAADLAALRKSLTETPRAPGEVPGQAPGEVNESLANQGRQMAALTARLSTLEAAIGNTARLDELNKRMTALESKSAEASSVLALSERVNTLEGAARSAASAQAGAVAYVMALGQWQGALASGRPFALELETAKALAARGNTAFDDTAFASYAASGLPTATDLQARFDTAAAAAVRAAAVPDNTAGWLRRILDRIMSVATVRRVDGDMEGASAWAIVARAESRLGQNDLAGAVREMESLQGEAARAAAPWVGPAHARLAAERTLSEATTKAIAAVAAAGDTAHPATGKPVN